MPVFHEFRDLIPVATPRGPGVALLLRCYGIESHDMWTVVMDADGSVWTFQNPDIRVQFNPTLGRVPKEKI